MKTATHVIPDPPARHGIEERSTPGRLNAMRAILKSEGQAGEVAIDNLIDAHHILLGAILRQQLVDLEDGTKLSNRVAVGTLDAHDRQQLRWALEQIPSVADLLGTPLFG